MRLLHLSDPHLGTEQPAVVDALIGLAQRLEPDALLISGDLTQRATLAQFDAAGRLLARLPPVPRLVLPGNHDIALWNVWQRLRRPYAAYERVAGARAPGGVSWLDAAGARVVAVDTTRWWRHRHGTLSAHQIDTAAALLRSAPPGVWRIVMTHHPLAVLHDGDREDRPRHHRRALQVWQDAGAELLIAGHLHDPGLIRVGPQCWVAQAGTSVSRRLPPMVRNSVQLLVAAAPGASGLAVARQCLRFDYDSASGRFMAAQQHLLYRSAARQAIDTRHTAWIA